MGKEYTEFSVLMSVYKSESSEFLSEAIDSVLSQSVKPSEIVLVEDGPLSAELYKVIQAYSNKLNTLKIVESKQNIGLGNALNLGMKSVSNNLVARMDTDDLCVQNRFELQLAEFSKFPDKAIVGGQVIEFEDNPKNIIGERRVPLTDNDIKKFARYRSPFNHPTVMMKKDKFEQSGGYQNFGRFEDYFLWAKMISEGYQMSNLSETLVYMRSGQDLYKRRGGFEYMRNYFNLKHEFFKMGIINKREELVGDSAMLLNAVLPVELRGLIYKRILHR